MAAFEILQLHRFAAEHVPVGVEVTIADEKTQITLLKDMYLKIIHAKNANVHVVATKGVRAELFHEIQSCVSELSLMMKLSQGSSITQVVLHDSASLRIEENYELHRGSEMKCAFGELAGNSEHKANYHLLGQGSNLQATYVYMNQQKTKKTNHIVVRHETGYTTANVENYGVVAGQSSLRVDVDARIAKGSIQSATHQTSRILTFEEGVNAKVTPSLYIDENDVQASHACSMGIIDEDHLYYLQSRGLTRKEAVALIVSGYLSPLSELLTADELRKEVSHMMESKAGEYIGYQVDSQ